MFRRSLLSAPALVAGVVMCFTESALANAETIAYHVDILNKLQTLEREVQELRGQLEVQSHQITVLLQQPNDHPTTTPAPVAEVTPPAPPLQQLTHLASKSAT